MQSEHVQPDLKTELKLVSEFVIVEITTIKKFYRIPHEKEGFKERITEGLEEPVTTETSQKFDLVQAFLTVNPDEPEGIGTKFLPSPGSQSNVVVSLLQR